MNESKIQKNLNFPNEAYIEKWKTLEKCSILVEESYSTDELSKPYNDPYSLTINWSILRCSAVKTFFPCFFILSLKS